MTWLNDPLNTFYIPPYPGDIFGEIWQKGLDLTDDVVAATNAISALTLDPQDLSGITLTQTSPMDVILSIPPAPPAVAINSPTLGSDPDSALIVSLLAQIRAAWEARLANATIDTAIFNRAVDRETKAQTASYENYLASQSSNGFSSATGQDQAMFAVFEKEKKGKLSEINREVMIYKFEADAKAIEGLQALENSALAFYVAQEEVMVKRVELLNAINNIILDHYRADVQAYETTGRITIEQAKFLIEQINSINVLNSNLTNLAVEKVKVAQAYEMGRFGQMVEANKAVGATLGQLTATMFNTINYSQSWSQGVSWSGSENGNA